MPLDSTRLRTMLCIWGSVSSSSISNEKLRIDVSLTKLVPTHMPSSVPKCRFSRHVTISTQVQPCISYPTFDQERLTRGPWYALIIKGYLIREIMCMLQGLPAILPGSRLGKRLRHVSSRGQAVCLLFHLLPEGTSSPHLRQVCKDGPVPG